MSIYLNAVTVTNCCAYCSITLCASYFFLQYKETWFIAIQYTKLLFAHFLNDCDRLFSRINYRIFKSGKKITLDFLKTLVTRRVRQVQKKSLSVANNLYCVHISLKKDSITYLHLPSIVYKSSILYSRHESNGFYV